MRRWSLIVLGLAATFMSLTTLGGMTKAQAASQPTLTGRTWQYHISAASRRWLRTGWMGRG